jgi:oligoendopeptidase F
MSNANASAKKRRAPIEQPPPPTNGLTNRNSSSNNGNGTVTGATGLTLPQVISVIDNRLIKLEEFMNQTTTSDNLKSYDNTNQNSQVGFSIESELIDEFNTRFEILSHEINNLKDMLLKLQTYTMDVNKTLMDERVNVFSDFRRQKLNILHSDIQDDSNINTAVISSTTITGEITSADLKSMVENELSSGN